MGFWTRWGFGHDGVLDTMDRVPTGNGFGGLYWCFFNVTLIMMRLFYLSTLLLLIVGLSACQQDNSHAAGEDHEHGPDTHTHAEPMTADTAGTYVDSTASFFDEDEHTADADHEHGPDTHTHDDDAPAHQ